MTDPARTACQERVEVAYARGDRVVVEHPQNGRHYGTVIGPHEHTEPAFLVRVDGSYVNPDWPVLAEWMRKPLGRRDMVIGDLLNLAMLKEAIEVEFLGTLWVKGDSGMLTPYVCETSFGDGFHLLTISTINQRPNYHVVRACSSWKEVVSGRWNIIRDDTIGEHIDEVITAIEEECGPRYWCDEECETCYPDECHCGDGDPWPAIDADYGCSWGEIDWSWLMKAIGYSKMIERIKP
jgi:hypothetical protein